MCPSVIRLIPELRSNQAVFLFPWNICCLYFLLLDLSLSFIAWFLNTQLFLFYLYTCIIWLEVRNRAQKTLPKERPVHRLLYVIGYLLKREGKCFCPSLGLAAFFLHEKHLIYLLLINSTYDTCSSIAQAPFLRYPCKWGFSTSGCNHFGNGEKNRTKKAIKIVVRVNTNLMICDLRTFPKCVIFIPI